MGTNCNLGTLDLQNISQVSCSPLKHHLYCYYCSHIVKCIRLLGTLGKQCVSRSILVWGYSPLTNHRVLTSKQFSKLFHGHDFKNRAKLFVYRLMCNIQECVWQICHDFLAHHIISLAHTNLSCRIDPWKVSSDICCKNPSLWIIIPPFCGWPTETQLLCCCI